MIKRHQYKFEIVKKKDAPDPYRSTSENYEPLYDALENMEADEVMIIEFEDRKHHNRVTSAIRSYFGAGAFSFRRLDKDRDRYLATPTTKTD